MFIHPSILKNTKQKHVIQNWDRKKSQKMFRVSARMRSKIWMSAELSVSVQRFVLVIFWLVR